MSCVEYLLKSANSCRLCWVLGLGFALAFAVCVAGELPGATCRTRVGSGLARDSSIFSLAKEALR